METLTVEGLYDIVQSQLCLYGNKKLFIRGEAFSTSSLSLLAGESSDQPFFEFTSKDIAETGEHSLNVLADRLAELDETLELYCSDDDAVLRGFVIGFQSKEDGFVETINSNELSQPTVVMG